MFRLGLRENIMKNMKFRVWKKDDDELLSYYTEKEDKSGCALHFDYQSSPVATIDIFGLYGLIFIDSDTFTPHAIDQFTGLQDRNGNDIYENDWLISKFIDGNDDTIYLRGKVVMNISGVCFDEGLHITQAFSDNPDDFCEFLGCKIVGNYHEENENPLSLLFFKELEKIYEGP